MTRRTVPWLDGRPHPRDLLAAEPFASALQEYAAAHGSTPSAVATEAEPLLDQMLASHRERVTDAWQAFGKWMLRAHDVVVDEEQIVPLRRLDRDHSLAFVFSHRSYLDGLVLPLALSSRRFGPTYMVGGANLDLPVFGPLASQSGMVFIRRSTRDSALYRVVLRSYVAYLARQGANLAWSIEGGRTRTGKLRPPTHGLLHYLAQAVGGDASAAVTVVPVSIVYDQLHEVPRMTREAKGATKRPEDLAWVLSLARSQRQRIGRAYLTFGTPIPLRERLAQLRAEGVEESGLVERIALDASHRINRATPITVTAVVCLALLGADRALTFDEVLVTVAPLAAYVGARDWPVAGGATLTDRSTIRRALHELVTSGVLDVYEAGTEAVWQVADGQHLVAAFYRNTVIHFLVGRAISELALLEAAELAAGASGEAEEPDPTGPTRWARRAWRSALALRDLLKFEFFFPGRADFEQELRDELATLAPGETLEQTARHAGEVLDHTPMYLAHLVLRPFLDAYHLLADRLAAAGGDDITGSAREELLDESLRLGEQWVRQRRIANEESVSLELLRTALKLADHRGLLAAPVGRSAGPVAGAAPEVGDQAGPEVGDQAGRTADPRVGLAARRAAFLDEIALLGTRLDRIAELAQRRLADQVATHLEAVDAAR